jgi:molybdopterin biosynthesis enzyme
MAAMRCCLCVIVLAADVIAPAAAPRAPKAGVDGPSIRPTFASTACSSVPS